MKEKEVKKKKNTELEKLQAELDEMKSLLQRTQADFINYRRRNEEDRANFAKFATADIIGQILPTLDYFRMAAKHVPEDLQGDNWVVGVQAIEKQLEDVLASNGLKTIETVGQKFDPSSMEAVGQEANPTENDDVVLKEEAAGYTLSGKLLRPAKVIVNNIK